MGEAGRSPALSRNGREQQAPSPITRHTELLQSSLVDKGKGFSVIAHF
jgi:hypothetical protein